MKVIIKPAYQILKERGLNAGGKVQKHIDSTVIRLMSKYTPFETGALIDSADKLTKIGSGEIKQGGSSAPYARKWYYTEAKFSGAPTRGTFWFERMKNEGGKEKILNDIRRMIK